MLHRDYGRTLVEQQEEEWYFIDILLKEYIWQALMDLNNLNNFFLKALFSWKKPTIFIQWNYKYKTNPSWVFVKCRSPSMPYLLKDLLLWLYRPTHTIANRLLSPKVKRSKKIEYTFLWLFLFTLSLKNNPVGVAWDTGFNSLIRLVPNYFFSFHLVFVTFYHNTLVILYYES